MRIDADLSSFLDLDAIRGNRPRVFNSDIGDIREISGKLGLNGEATVQLINILINADANAGASFKLSREDGGTLSIDIDAEIKITIHTPKGNAVYTLADIDGNINVSLKDNSNGALGLSVDLLANLSSDLLGGLSAALEGALDISRENANLSLDGNLKLDKPLFDRWRNG
jgi:hypothetical protein